MDTRDKNQDIAAESFMTPDSGMSQAPIEMNLTVLTDSDLATTLGANELKDLKEPLKKPPTPFQESMRRLRRDKRAMTSIGIIFFFVLLALFGPFLYQHIGGIYNSPISGPIGPQVYHTYYHQELSRQDELPSWMYFFYSDLGKADMQARQLPSFQYWLGTDQLGRDILARLMQGILISIAVALLVEVVDVGAGITVGVLAGYNGGAIDQVLARFTDIIFAFPGLLFIILVSGIWGEWADTALSNIPIIGANGNARLLVVSIALAFVAWPLMARYVRGQTLQLKEQQFIEAARTAGTSNFRIMMRHIVAQPVQYRDRGINTQHRWYHHRRGRYQPAWSWRTTPWLQSWFDDFPSTTSSCHLPLGNSCAHYRANDFCAGVLVPGRWVARCL